MVVGNEGLEEVPVVGSPCYGKRPYGDGVDENYVGETLLHPRTGERGRPDTQEVRTPNNFPTIHSMANQKE